MFLKLFSYVLNMCLACFGFGMFRVCFGMCLPRFCLHVVDLFWYTFGILFDMFVSCFCMVCSVFRIFVMFWYVLTCVWHVFGKCFIMFWYNVGMFMVRCRSVSGMFVAHVFDMCWHGLRMLLVCFWMLLALFGKLLQGC